MEKCLVSRFLSITLLLLFAGVFLMNCNSSKSKIDTDNKVETDSWYNSRIWLNGLQLEPHESINKNEFSKQYHKKSLWWDEAFNFIKTHDLKTLAPGKYIIDSGNVFATISEDSAIDKDHVKWESHRNFNDLQAIIKGRAQMGIASVADSNYTISVPYSNQTDTQNYLVHEDAAKYYDAVPGAFFIFSPLDIHRPAIKVKGYDIIKKIVIKVRVP